MAQPSYTTDLADVTTCADNTGWSELSGHSSGGADATETTQFIQGAACVSQTTGVATAQTTGLEFDYGSDITAFTDNTDVFLFWLNWLAPVAIDTWENSGTRVAVGSSSGNVNFWKAVGSDYGRHPYGGWQNIAIDPTFTADATDGTPTASNYAIFGMNPNILSAVSKGNPNSIDAIRWGRAELIIEHGDITNGYGTFPGLGNASSANDVSFTADTTDTDATLTNIAVAEVDKLYSGAPIVGTGIPASTYVKYIVSTTSVEMTNAATATNSAEAMTSQPYNSWGLLQVEGTGYLWKGLMSFGNVTNACDFRDSNANITIDDTPRAYALFNKIEINNATSRVDWTNVSFTTLNESGLSAGSFEMTADATVNLTNCVFTGMTTFIFDSNATVTSTTFRRCGLVTQGGGTFDGCAFDSTTATQAITVDSLVDIIDCNFISDGSSYAVDLGTISTTAGVTWANYLSGYETYAAGGTSTGNEAVLVSVDSGKTLTINVSSGYDTPSFNNVGLGDVSVVNSVTLEVNGVKTTTEPTNYVRCRIEKTSDQTQIMNEEAQTSYGGDGFYKAIESYAFVSDTAVTIRARYRGYLPFETTGIITSAGLTVTAVWVTDPNYT